MSISIHIPFYNPNPEKKEGYRNLRRFDYLEENIINLKTLSIKNDIFIHTHNDFLDDKNLNAKEKKQAQIKKMDLLKKMQAVRAGAGEDIVASHEPEGEQIGGAKQWHNTARQFLELRWAQFWGHLGPTLG